MSIARDELALHQAAWSRTLQSLSRTLVHELRGPINSISLNLQLVARVAGDEALDRRKQGLEAMAAQITALARQSSTLGELLVAPTTCDDQDDTVPAAELFERLRNLLEPHARRRASRLELRVGIESEPPLRLSSAAEKPLIQLLVWVLDQGSERVVIDARTGSPSGHDHGSGSQAEVTEVEAGEVTVDIENGAGRQGESDGGEADNDAPWRHGSRPWSARNLLLAAGCRVDAEARWIRVRLPVVRRKAIDR